MLTGNTSIGLPNAAPTERRTGLGFVQSIQAALDQTEYRRVETGEELEAVYHLRYRSYLKVNLVGPSADGIVTDALDRSPNCYTYAVMLDGQLAATMRFHHVTRETPWSPAMSMFGDLLEPRLEAGESFIDPSRFAVDPELETATQVLPLITMRLVFMACVHFNTPYCITMIQAHHEAFYRRLFRSTKIAEPRRYKGAVNCVVPLYEGDISAVRGAIEARFPFFASSAAERRMLFDRPSLGTDAPLSVLPTTRLLRRAA